MWYQVITLFAMVGFCAPAVFGDDPLKAFPQADVGMQRFVLSLPKEEDEELRRVELIVGKTETLDDRNRYFFGGRIDEETIQGWGYTRYVLKVLGPLAGTLIAPEPNAPKVERFITVGGEPYLIRYNSRLPVVVYVPLGVEVRYRIWHTEPEMLSMSNG